MISAHQIDTIEPTEATILVRCSPASLGRGTLIALASIAEPTGRATELRSWLRDCVASETNRRLCDGHDGGAPREAAAWIVPWHKWTDGELAEALAASYSWFGMNLDSETVTVINAIHRAIVCVCACRLNELHAAILLSQSRNQ